MNQKAEILEIIKIWIQKAENDLKNANHTMLMDDNCPFDTVCFHAQQSVEKYLKALLISKNIPFPKSHDLTELLSLLPGKIKKHFSLSKLALIMPCQFRCLPSLWRDSVASGSSYPCLV